jgi:hypothetical protein
MAESAKVRPKPPPAIKAAQSVPTAENLRNVDFLFMVIDNPVNLRGM